MPEFNSSNYVFLLILMLIVYIPIALIIYFVGRKKYKLNPLRQTALFVFWTYIYFAIYRLVCPIFEVDFYDNLTIIPQSEDVFVPFEQIFNCIGEMMGGGMGMGLADLLRPVVIALPVGFLMALLWDAFYRRKILASLVCFLVGLLIQVPQIWTKRGFIFDDAMLYALGAFLGALLLVGVEKFAHNRAKFGKIEK